MPKNIFTSTTMSFIISALLFISSSANAAPQKTVKAQDIIDKLNAGQDVYYENIEISEDLDFTKVKNVKKVKVGLVNSSEAVVGNQQKQELYNYEINVNSKITLKNCLFKGKVSAYYNNPDVNKDVYYYTVFNKDVSFYKSTFTGMTVFNCSDFRGQAVFREVYFKDLAYFLDANFQTVGDFTAMKYNEEPLLFKTTGNVILKK